jgi:hypothetical protein
MKYCAQSELQYTVCKLSPSLRLDEPSSAKKSFSTRQAIEKTRQASNQFQLAIVVG